MKVQKKIMTMVIAALLCAVGIVIDRKSVV